MAGSLRIPGLDKESRGVLEVSQLSYWQINWGIPAAMVKAASIIGGGWSLQQLYEGLTLIVGKGEPWMKELAKELLSDKRLLERLVIDLHNGMSPDRRIVEIILRKVSV